MATRPSHWTECFTGYMQTEGRVTGVVELYHDIRQACNCPESVLHLRSWRDDAWQVAEHIWRMRPRRIVLIGYSYGGYTATLVARELNARGVVVDALLLCDAVWRTRASIASPLSLFSRWTIDVPPNVRRLWSWRQMNNLPAGHQLKIAASTEIMHGEMVPNVRHQYMDDYHVFHAEALRVACERKAA
jgi:thioesterase domain-containing protein